MKKVVKTTEVTSSSLRYGKVELYNFVKAYLECGHYKYYSGGLVPDMLICLFCDVPENQTCEVYDDYE